ncbi:hypothetical protein AB0K51_31190 [Kitasatospora sp. NPDC049285]|uniref:hypothetical protein n=1 Tax=Kitasatospora sp. NPDC049285 TaxID=3157096 RepID=UPI0034143CBE
MTSQRQPHTLAAEHQPPAGHRSAGERGRKAAMWSIVAALAAGGVWLVSKPHPGDVLPGLGPTSNQPSASPLAVGQAAPPLTEAQSFNTERYFPAQRAIELDGYRARRTAGRDGADCQAIQLDKTRDLLKDLSCQGWLALALTRTDQQVISSVAVLRFADPRAAGRALEAIRDKAADFEFTYPDGVGAPAATVKPMTAARIEQAGHYLTVTLSRYADQRAGTAPDALLIDSTRSAAAAAGSPFMWM